ncbi:MAG: DUF2007 domain-containing protein [Acidobacteriota bacterium]
MVCPTCDLETVDRLPGPEPTPDVELVPVFATGDAALIALAQSLLDGAEIDYLLRENSPRGLFGVGRLPGYPAAMSTSEFWIRADDADRVRILLEDLIAAGQGRDAAGGVES